MSSILHSVRWQDVVDVLIIATVGFHIYLWVRETVAFRILAAMLTLLLLSEVASRTGLVLTGTLLQGVGAVAVFAVVVVFRDEIRRGLGRVSPLRLLQPQRPPPGEATLREITATLFALAGKRVGALIVFPRRELLSEHILGGRRLDAEASGALLEALFSHESPLHDGAAVVVGGRIRDIAARLPLSRNLELPQVFGTRHRAAVGLTEVSDAVTVVVSEQRGEVSVAVGGAIAICNSADHLLRQLSMLVLPAPTQRRFWQPLKEHVPARALILGLTALAWVVLARSDRTQVMRPLPLEFRAVPAGLALVRSSSQEVRVQLHGPTRLVRALSLEEVHSSIDLAEAGSGSLDYPVRVTVPPGVQVLAVDPPVVTVSLAPLETRSVRVLVQLVGRWPPGAHPPEVVVSPAEVRVVGPAPAVSADGLAVKTEPIPRRSLRGGSERRARLLVPPPLRLAEGSAAEVKVTARNPAAAPAPTRQSPPGDG